MKRFAVGGSGPVSSNIVLGLMRIEQLSDEEIRTLWGTARDAGIDFVDHADIYGSVTHACEARFGQAVTLRGTDREQMRIQSKVGIRKGWYDFSTEHILESVDGSLAALGTDYLDVLLLHRPDALVEPDEVAAAFDILEAAGKVRHFGVSNHTPGQIELLRRSLNQPLIANQVQLSIPHAPLIAAGVAMNIGSSDQAVDRDNGVLDYARLTGITLQAWSPLQDGFGNGPFVGDREHYALLNDLLDEFADSYGLTPTGVAVAWITRHPAEMQVVLGTTTPSRVVEAAEASESPLTRHDWYRLFTAAGHTVP